MLQAIIISAASVVFMLGESFCLSASPQDEISSFEGLKEKIRVWEIQALADKFIQLEEWKALKALFKVYTGPFYAGEINPSEFLEEDSKAESLLKFARAAEGENRYYRWDSLPRSETLGHGYFYSLALAQALDESIAVPVSFDPAQLQGIHTMPNRCGRGVDVFRYDDGTTLIKATFDPEEQCEDSGRYQIKLSALQNGKYVRLSEASHRQLLRLLTDLARDKAELLSFDYAGSYAKGQLAIAYSYRAFDHPYLREILDATQFFSG